MAIALTTFFVAAVLLYLFVLLYKQRNNNLKLQRKLALSEISALEEERSRIAADLHDDLGPLLSAIKFRVSSVNTDSEEDKFEIHISTKLIDDAILRLRQISNDLLPTSLARKGLVEAIQELVVINSQKEKLKIDFIHPADISVPQDKKIHIYRMVQEAIFNCVKHANATRLLLDLKKEGENLYLTITDNGCGLIIKDPSSLSGRGLTSLSNRTSIMGGNFHLHAEANKGTILHFEIPI